MTEPTDVAAANDLDGVARHASCVGCRAEITVYDELTGMIPTEEHGERWSNHGWRVCELTAEVRRLRAAVDEAHAALGHCAPCRVDSPVAVALGALRRVGAAVPMERGAPDGATAARQRINALAREVAAIVDDHGPEHVPAELLERYRAAKVEEDTLP